jgi:hypothetical protein
MIFFFVFEYKSTKSNRSNQPGIKLRASDYKIKGLTSWKDLSNKNKNNKNKNIVVIWIPAFLSSVF